MDKWTHVFVRNDAVLGPFNSPYLGPFEILSQAKKHFKLDMNGRTEIVSVDRLEKAHFERDVTDLDVFDTPTLNPLHSPLHTPTPLFSSPSTPDLPPQTEKIIQDKIRKDGALAEETVQDSLYLIRLACMFFSLFLYNS